MATGSLACRSSDAFSLGRMMRLSIVSLYRAFDFPEHLHRGLCGGRDVVNVGGFPCGPVVGR